MPNLAYIADEENAYAVVLRDLDDPLRNNLYLTKPVTPVKAGANAWQFEVILPQESAGRQFVIHNDFKEEAADALNPDLPRMAALRVAYLDPEIAQAAIKQDDVSIVLEGVEHVGLATGQPFSTGTHSYESTLSSDSLLHLIKMNST